ncbi:putative transcription factor NAM family [Helianthus annuus]|nr:putative transcription factor NAM family [Helianthus annuus]
MVSKSKTASSGGKCFPPGFRFHPTDEELVLYYLKRKICRRSVKLDIIADVDVYKWDPEELPANVAFFDAVAADMAFFMTWQLTSARKHGNAYEVPSPVPGTARGRKRHGDGRETSPACRVRRGNMLQKGTAFGDVQETFPACFRLFFWVFPTFRLAPLRFPVVFCVEKTMIWQSKLKTGDRQWFFFSPSKKYANGGRSSRATMNGYWKATGKDRIIKRKSSSVGIKKTLVYYHGRAPSGQRTDWVMHEYTMDEEELKRCPVAQEHYVLYKIFKKSGAGPKNGEQYGAPFVEEEWNDEDCLDCLDVDSLLVQKPNPVSLNEFENTSAREEGGEGIGLSNDMIEFLNKIIDEPDILPPDPKILEKNGNVLLEGSSSRVEKDFLELDDLVGPDTRISNSVTDFYSISDFDFYHESQGAYNMGHLEYGPGPGPENLGLVSEVVNNVHELHDELPVSYDLWNHCDQSHSSIMTVQTVHEPVPSSARDQMDNGPMARALEPDSWSSRPSLFSPFHERYNTIIADLVIFPFFVIFLGVVIEENLARPEYYPNQCPENVENKSESWFSSAVWAFVDSIPTTPASASESSAVVNKAFERMSSFSRGRNVNLAATAASGSATKRLGKPKPSSSSRGIVYFSVLGVLFAILWVFVGSSIELLSRFVWL